MSDCRHADDLKDWHFNCGDAREFCLHDVVKFEFCLWGEIANVRIFLGEETDIIRIIQIFQATGYYLNQKINIFPSVRHHI